MPELMLRVGSRSAQGVRSNNEDRFVVDLRQRLFIVADGMGGQDRGEVASSMAAEIIPRIVQTRLAAGDDARCALLAAMSETNDAIVKAGRHQPEGRRMGTTAVVALVHAGAAFITHLGDSRAYLIHGEEVRLLTVDHSVAQALVLTGALTPQEARHSPYQHVLHKFLGCTELQGATEVQSFTPQRDDRLLLGSDGLTNHVTDDDLRTGPVNFPDPQLWIDHLVQQALERGSRDNATGVVIHFGEPV
jgi:protein phosphatase